MFFGNIELFRAHFDWLTCCDLNPLHKKTEDTSTSSISLRSAVDVDSVGTDNAHSLQGSDGENEGKGWWSNNGSLVILIISVLICVAAFVALMVMLVKKLKERNEFINAVEAIHDLDASEAAAAAAETTKSVEMSHLVDETAP